MPGNLSASGSAGHFFLGIDLGTGSLKLSAYAARGARRSPATFASSYSAQRAYPMLSPSPGVAETAPEAWIGALRATWADVRAQMERAGLAPRLVSIGLSGQMHGFVPMGRDGRALHRAITWADTRGAEFVEGCARALGGEAGAAGRSGEGGQPEEGWRPEAGGLFGRLLNAPAAGLTALSLLWMKLRDPDLYRATATILFPKDYLRYRLTGAMATDPGDASASLLWDFVDRDWSDRALAALGLDGGKLPAPLDSFSIAGAVCREAALETGLPEGVPVAVGSADKACELYGSGFFHAYFERAGGAPAHSAADFRSGSARRTNSAPDPDWSSPRIAQVSIGTGIQIVVPTLALPPYAPGLNLFETCAPGLRYRMAAMLNGGLALEWVRAALQGSWADLYADLENGDSDFSQALSRDLPRDLIFLPYLSGERSPFQNPRARGAWIGLGLHHSRRDMFASALLGVACTIRLGIESLNLAPDAAVYCVGGSTSFRPWMNIVAAVTGRRLFVSAEPDASVRGAAAIGLSATLSQAERLAPAELETSALELPQPVWMDEYYSQFLKYYEALFDQTQSSEARISPSD